MSVYVTSATWHTRRRRARLEITSVLVPGSPATVTEPIALVDAQRHIKQPASTPEDTDMERWITTARALVERQTALALVPTTRDLYLSGLPWPGIFELPIAPVHAVDEFVTIAADDTETAVPLEDYWVNLISRPPRIGVITVPSLSDARPYLPIRIRVTAGYAFAEAIPPELMQAMYLLVAFWSEHRGDELPTRDQADLDVLKLSGAYPLVERFRLPEVA